MSIPGIIRNFLYDQKHACVEKNIQKNAFCLYLHSVIKLCQTIGNIEPRHRMNRLWTLQASGNIKNKATKLTSETLKYGIHWMPWRDLFPLNKIPGISVVYPLLDNQNKINPIPYYLWYFNSGKVLSFLQEPCSIWTILQPQWKVIPSENNTCCGWTQE